MHGVSVEYRPEHGMLSDHSMEDDDDAQDDSDYHFDGVNFQSRTRAKQKAAKKKHASSADKPSKKPKVSPKQMQQQSTDRLHSSGLKNKPGEHKYY